MLFLVEFKLFLNLQSAGGTVPGTNFRPSFFYEKLSSKCSTFREALWKNPLLINHSHY